MSNLNIAIFGIYPYIAIAVCVIGCWIRFDREAYTWKADSSQMLSNKGFRMASILFHVGVLFILMGHVVGLLMPEALYHHFISTPNKQLLAMVSGGFFGVLCLIGLVMLIARRLGNERVRATSSKSDIFILILLLVQLLLGLLTIFVSAQHMDGSVMVLLANWAQGVVMFQGLEAASYIANVNIIYKLHVFVGLTMILVFPFTRLVHMISAPIWYLGRRYQVVRQR
jgi:nitrate reductase gamma subunit